MTDHEQLDLFFDRRRASMVEDIRALVRVNSVKGEACPGAPFGSGPTAALDAALALARREGWTEEDWEEELYATLAHEFTHHVESLANAHGLDDKDEEELLRLLEKYRDAP